MTREWRRRGSCPGVGRESLALSFVSLGAPPARDAPVLELGGVARLLEALLASCDAVPLAAGPAVGSLRAAASVVVVASARVLEVALALAAPVIVALWLTDLALGMIARDAPQVPVYFVALPAKGLLAVGVMLLGIGALDHALTTDLPTVDRARAPLARGLGLKATHDAGAGPDARGNGC
jgi:hypothetical protein